MPAVFGEDDDYVIRFLSLYGNLEMTGEIPHNIGRMTKLTHFDLSCCAFTGIIPASMNHLTNLKYLYLGVNDNQAEQDFPLLGQLIKLHELSLRGATIFDVIHHYVGERLLDLVLLDDAHGGTLFLCAYVLLKPIFCTWISLMAVTQMQICKLIWHPCVRPCIELVDEVLFGQFG